MKCKFCEYEWITKKESPVACPRCKNRFDRPGRTVGLQIGGFVGPEDKVGMYISMPLSPGTGVSINLDSQFDNVLETIMPKLGDIEPKEKQLKVFVRDTLHEKNNESKLKKIHTIVMTGAGIAKIVNEIGRLTKLLGY
ncbi:MAG: hypothetical protein A3I05_04075 [Deltaproteobacteria bacterium RIFCSPLOWO2_02_FULL_44_10]|nr:MAG: hypothetical protein A3C46_03775 [Deltaproteobacteria bacterium RIFCSPHIGHO2_02_FULL_44_16]OGQ46323.1 MAG: hypothetical protein A3I05_04075 [Deltaproteobacteria bacterium RIFCSPLOWO2_02_FULL_44_10]